MFEDKQSTLYMQLYNHFKELIVDGTFPAGTKLPSVRRCAQELAISKTTVETAYLQLTAEGYVQSKPQSGYYVCTADFADVQKENENDRNFNQIEDIEFSASESATDFDFALWQRYLKSALRNTDRLLGYGHPQGEPELRSAVCEYLIKNREVYCTAENIVIGAGTQTLLHLLYALCRQPANVAVAGPVFKQGAAVFEDHGAAVYHYDILPDNLQELREQNIGLLYLFPSHEDCNGHIMPITQRMKLLQFAKNNHIIIAEDDYGSELQPGHIAPSLQGLDAGKCVAYLGTFSKLLIPGIRISYLVLPTALMENYKDRMYLYNQTASKLEQLALSAFIRDGRLEQQIRRTRRRKKSQ
ncbi:MAG: PLP-dependent aminotransferase family protein [Ruminococcaceae bacterium]|nr:PLP-dependent aminotransferase family protein [Oscillospiraceae bacterium]